MKKKKFMKNKKNSKIEFPNFYKDERFIKLKERLGIDPNKVLDFENDTFESKFNSSLWETIKSKKGQEINDLNKIFEKEDGTLGYEGVKDNVLMYINTRKTERIKEWGYPKYHIAFCDVLEKQKAKGVLDSYVLAIKTEDDPDFDFYEIHNDDFKENYTTKLSVCRMCLKKLGYDNSLEGVRNFSLRKFFDKYSDLIYLPQLDESYYLENGNFYPEDWEKISYNYRKSVNWKCEKCGKDCRKNKRYLHTHHINSVKTNNKESNLKALCLRCHSKEPGHSHLKLQNRKLELEEVNSAKKDIW